MAGLRDALPGCTPDPGQVVTPHAADPGTDAVTFALTYEQGLGGAAYQVVRVGSAVLGVIEAGEFSSESMADYVPELTEQNRYLVDQLGCHWGAGCAAEPVALSPAGAGPLTIGATVEDLREAAPAAAFRLAGDGGCSTLTWTSPSGTRLSGAVMPRAGLAYVAGGAGVETAEGLAVGASLDELRVAYPEVEEADNAMWWVDRGDTDYSIGVTDGRVSEVGVLADDQGCVG